MELIYDRTEADVLLGSPKGCYSHRDLNRVETAVAQLQSLAPALDLHPGLTVKTDWGLPGVFTPDSYPTKSQMTRYLHNVRTLCALLGVEAALPDTVERLTYRGANAIEGALQRCYDRIAAVQEAFRYGGELYAGTP